MGKNGSPTSSCAEWQSHCKKVGGMGERKTSLETQAPTMCQELFYSLGTQRLVKGPDHPGPPGPFVLLGEDDNRQIKYIGP